MKTNKILADMSSEDKVFIRRNARKIKAIVYSGKFCKMCKKNLYKSPWLAEFHHLDPKTKDHAMTDRFCIANWNIVREEAKKCILLCSNCHRETHYNIKRFFEFRKTIYALSKKNGLGKLYQRKATKDEIAKAKEMFVSGLSYKEISRRINFKEGTLRIWFPMNKYINLNDNKVEEKIIELYEKQKKTAEEICGILHCNSRTFKRKILSMVQEGKISSYRKNRSNQHIKDPTPVMINGSKYSSITEASKILKIGRSTMYARIKRGAKGYSYF